jgi:serine/threonine protein phosphatase 1
LSTPQDPASGRILAIGDIHGCSKALDTLLELVKPTEDDTLVFLGDYVDRGPDARGVLERLIELSRREKFVALCGNHDLWMLRARCEKSWRRSWLGMGVGGMDTLASYHAQSFTDVPETHWEFLAKLSPWYETEDFLFTHASVNGHLPLAQQDEEWLYWRRVVEATQHYSGKILICGHTAQHSGVPLDLGYAICIDTWAYSGGYLSCLECKDGYLWQASQNGQTREGRLEDFANSIGD